MQAETLDQAEDQDQDQAEEEVQFIHPRMEHFLEYWDELRAGDKMPKKSAFDPLHVPRLLPHILMIETLHGRRHYAIRVMGTALVEQFEGDCTDQSLVDIPLGGAYADFDAALRNCVRDQAPVTDDFSLMNTEGWRIPYQVLMLPFSDPKGEKTACVMMIFAFGQPERVDE